MRILEVLTALKEEWSRLLPAAFLPSFLRQLARRISPVMIMQYNKLQVHLSLKTHAAAMSAQDSIRRGVRLDLQSFATKWRLGVDTKLCNMELHLATALLALRSVVATQAQNLRWQRVHGRLCPRLGDDTRRQYSPIGLWWPTTLTTNRRIVARITLLGDGPDMESHWPDQPARLQLGEDAQRVDHYRLDPEELAERARRANYIAQNLTRARPQTPRPGRIAGKPTAFKL